MSDARDDWEVVECKTCGASPLSVYHMCDRIDGTWCCKCFARKPCGMGKHGEGCAVNVFEDRPGAMVADGTAECASPAAIGDDYAAMRAYSPEARLTALDIAKECRSLSIPSLATETRMSGPDQQAQIQLLQCPLCSAPAFCIVADLHMSRLGDTPSLWECGCQRCDVSLKRCTRDEAIAAWNRRAPEVGNVIDWSAPPTAELKLAYEFYKANYRGDTREELRDRVIDAARIICQDRRETDEWLMLECALASLDSATPESGKDTV